jgi:DNA sulfur modification protein DndD
MYIKKVEIKNFRIYHGTNPIVFPIVPGKNVYIISGDNGHGKTTFLTSLVWCLYGKQMQEVDKFYKDRILANGGYKGYLASCMNKQALSMGEAEFSVSVDLEAVALPGVQCESVQIMRRYNINKESESVEIKMGNTANELVDELGQQLFIQEFILPKETAKFFFFDAERIVTIAEMQSIEDKRLLSQAYSEVLGIKKYEDLRRNLNDLRIRFRKDSANHVERVQFKDLGEEIARLKKSTKRKESRRERLLSGKDALRTKSDELQEKLLLEGNQITLSEIKQLQDEGIRLSEGGKAFMREFRDLLELAPFAIVGSTLIDIQKQLEIEEKHSKLLTDTSLLENKIEAVIRSLRDGRGDQSVGIDVDLARLRSLLRKFLIEDEQDSIGSTVSVLHDFTNEQRNSLNAMISNLRTSYGDRLRSISRLMRINRQDYSTVSRKLANIDVMETDALVKKYRTEKTKLDLRTQRIDEEIQALSQGLGALENDIDSKEKRYEEIARKVRLNEEFRDKDILVNRLIDELDAFIKMIKMKRKDSLEYKVLSNINTLMHKKGFIHKVVVEIGSNMMDIHLIDGRDQEIGRDDLSKGEQQLYASAILKALVEESGIDFPVLVDSPLQKFDDKHSKSVITSFYPQISKQVILLPLLNRELAKEEYELLERYVNSTFVIDNLSEEASQFREVDPGRLFTESVEFVGTTSND